MIRIENCTFGYERGLYSSDSLELENGKLYALAGANGSGKSTFLKTLNGDLRPFNKDAGIYLDTQDLFSLSLREKALKITFVSSKSEGIPFLKVRDYVALGRTPYTGTFGTLSEADHALIDSTIAQLGIGHIASKMTTAISDGERQTASIARALVQQTSCILLDEPTAFLDYQNRVKLIELLREIAKREQKCIILSSHDLDLLLESQPDFLLIDQQQRKLKHFRPGACSRTELLKIAFGA